MNNKKIERQEEVIDIVISNVYIECSGVSRGWTHVGACVNILMCDA